MIELLSLLCNLIILIRENLRVYNKYRYKNLYMHIFNIFIGLISVK